MFRLQNNVPEVYVQESRDYQLLLRLYDSWNSGVNYSIKTILNILDSVTVSDSLLELLATRVGFFSRVRLDTNVLRYIVGAFPYLIRDKGTEKGIREAVYTILKAENNPDAVEPIVVSIQNNTHNIQILTTNTLYNKAALKELLRYILPFGYTYTLGQYVPVPSLTNIVELGSALTSNFEPQEPTYNLGQAVSSKDINEGENINGIIGTYNAGVVIGTGNINGVDSNEDGTTN